MSSYAEQSENAQRLLNAVKNLENKSKNGQLGGDNTERTHDLIAENAVLKEKQSKAKLRLDTLIQSISSKV